MLTFSRRDGFTLIEIIVVMAIIGILMAFLLPALEKGREKANTVRCAANLGQIGLGLTLYANDNHGHYPRTVYDPAVLPCAGTNPSANDPFRPGGPQANDVTAALFLLIRVEKVPAAIFNDPYTDELQTTPDPATDPLSRSNFTDYKANLAYSYANPYPNLSASAKGYDLTSKMSASLPLAADRNPGTGPGKNSRNHEGRGQNVLFADIHVEWETTTQCGANKDDIYTNKNNVVKDSPVDATDTILLPDGN